MHVGIVYLQSLNIIKKESEVESKIFIYHIYEPILISKLYIFVLMF